MTTLKQIHDAFDKLGRPSELEGDTEALKAIRATANNTEPANVSVNCSADVAALVANTLAESPAVVAAIPTKPHLWDDGAEPA